MAFCNRVSQKSLSGRFWLVLICEEGYCRFCNKNTLSKSGCQDPQSLQCGIKDKSLRGRPGNISITFKYRPTAAVSSHHSHVVPRACLRRLDVPVFYKWMFFSDYCIGRMPGERRNKEESSCILARTEEDTKSSKRHASRHQQVEPHWPGKPYLRSTHWTKRRDWTALTFHMAADGKPAAGVGIKSKDSKLF